MDLDGLKITRNELYQELADLRDTELRLLLSASQPTPQDAPSASPWLSATEAAEYLRCALSRVRKLTSTGDLPCERDGRRVLYHRDQLDEYIRAGGASCP